MNLGKHEFAIPFLISNDENREKLQYIKESIQEVLMVLQTFGLNLVLVPS
jgi:hypothetical protein